MLGRRELPATYTAWNDRWGAPYGYQSLGRLATGRITPRSLLPRVLGPFAFQPNNSIRRFEYPWAYFAGEVRGGQHVIDLGGGLAGFQFTLARAGAHVVNVDPGDEGRGWTSVTEENVAWLNRALRCNVELRRSCLPEAAPPSEHYDRIFSISTLEHLQPEEIRSVVTEARRLLVPGGRFVLTVDLSLDLYPFTDAAENVFGTNVHLKALVALSGLQIVQGDPVELYGFEEFDPQRVLRQLGDFCCGDQYPALCQALVLEKMTADAVLVKYDGPSVAIRTEDASWTLSH